MCYIKKYHILKYYIADKIAYQFYPGEVLLSYSKEGDKCRQRKLTAKIPGWMQLSAF